MNAKRTSSQKLFATLFMDVLIYQAGIHERSSSETRMYRLQTGVAVLSSVSDVK